MRWQCLSAKPYETLDFQNSTTVRWGHKRSQGEVRLAPEALPGGLFKVHFAPLPET